MIRPITGAECYGEGEGKSMRAGQLVTSSCVCKNLEGAGFPFQVESLEDGVDDGSTLSTFTTHTMGRVRWRTSTKQRSSTLVVRSLCHKCRGKAKNRQQFGQVSP